VKRRTVSQGVAAMVRDRELLILWVGTASCSGEDESGCLRDRPQLTPALDMKFYPHERWAVVCALRHHLHRAFVVAHTPIPGINPYDHVAKRARGDADGRGTLWVPKD